MRWVRFQTHAHPTPALVALVEVPGEEEEEEVEVCISFLPGNCQDESIQAAFAQKGLWSVRA